MKTIQVIIKSIVILILICVLSACGEDESTQTPVTPNEPVTITIGHFADFTNYSKDIVPLIPTALEDMVNYYNDENLISGVNLSIVSCDTQGDPTKCKSCYDELKNGGADILFSDVDQLLEFLKPLADTGETPLFVTVPDNSLNSLGYTYGLGALPQVDATLMLEWLATNDPDFPKDRPAKIGGAYFFPQHESYLLTAEEYAKKDNRYEWVGSFFYDLMHYFEVDSPISELKDCDYIIPPLPMHYFINDYVDYRCDAKLIGNEYHTSFLWELESYDLWDYVDGMLFTRTYNWWNESDPSVSLAKSLLPEKCDDCYKNYAQSGLYLDTICDIHVTIP